jgi:hypothetical protein
MSVTRATKVIGERPATVSSSEHESCPDVHVVVSLHRHGVRAREKQTSR